MTDETMFWRNKCDQLQKKIEYLTGGPMLPGEMPLPTFFCIYSAGKRNCIHCASYNNKCEVQAGANYANECVNYCKKG